MYKNKRISVVIPALNEERFIAIVLNKIPEYVDQIYVIDDASTDTTNEIASKIAASHPDWIKVIRNSENYGVGKSIIIGYKRSIVDGIDVAVVMAGDNQMDANELPRLIDPIIEGIADYTAGDRLSDTKNMKGMPVFRQLGNRILKWLTRVAAWNFKIRDPQHGFTAVTREALLKLDLDSIFPRYGYLNDMLVKMSVAKIKILYVYMPSIYGDEKSKIRYWRYIPSVSWLLLKDCLWRMKVQFLRRDSIKKPKITDNTG